MLGQRVTYTTKRFILAVLGVSLLLSTVYIPPKASAAPADDPQSRLQAALYAKSLAYCMKNSTLQSKGLSGHQYIAQDSIEKGEWFADRTRTFYEGTGGTTNGMTGDGKDCSDTGWVVSAYKSLGFNTGRDALLAFGFKEEPDGGVAPNPNKNDASNNLLQNAAKGYGKVPSLDSPETQYLLYHKIMYSDIGCKAQHTDSATIADGNNGARFKVVNNNPPPLTKDESVIFQGKSDGDEVIEYENGGQHSKISCQEVANRINKYADRAAKALKEANQVPNNNDGNAADANGEKGKQTCTVEGVGWMVCPVSKLIGKIVDQMYKMMQALLRVPPLNTDTNDSNPLYGSWSAMRNIANVVFVILFMMVIYSQITSAGISNYGVKKILPKLVVGALLINLSYWICVLAVDLSNVIGTSIYDILYTLYKDTLDTTSWEVMLVWLLSGGAIGAAGVLAFLATGTSFMTAALWLMVPLTVIALLALLVGLSVLAFRQGLIILLVFISPLAFAAYLLPNTQVWFDKWRKLFTTMLVFYPLMSMLFGGAQIAAGVLISTSKPPTPTGVGVVLVGAGMLVQVLPLFMAPMLMKNSTGFLGKVGGKIQSMGNRAAAPLNKFAKGQARERAALAGAGILAGQRNNRMGRLATRISQRMERGSRTRKLQKESLGAGRDAAWADEVAEAQAGTAIYDANQLARTSKLSQGRAEAQTEAMWNEQVATDATLSDLDTAKRVQEARGSNASAQRTSDYNQAMDANQAMQVEAGGIRQYGAQRAFAAARSANVKEFVENVGSEKSTMSTTAASQLQRQAEDISQSVEHRAASAGMVVKNGSDADIQNMLTSLGTARDAQQRALAQAQANNDQAGIDAANHELGNIRDIQQQFASDLGSRKPAMLGAQGMGSLTRGEFGGSYNDQIKGRVIGKKIDGGALASMSPDDRKALISHITTYKDAVAAGGQADQAYEEGLKSLQTAMDEFESNERNKGSITGEAVDHMKEIRTQIGR